MIDPASQSLYLFVSFKFKSRDYVFRLKQGRQRLIDGVYKMGVKFMQERETIHTAIEMLDRYYMHMSQVLDLSAFRKEFMHPRIAI